MNLLHQKRRESYLREGLAKTGKTVLAKEIATKWATGKVFKTFAHLKSWNVEIWIMKQISTIC